MTASLSLAPALILGPHNVIWLLFAIFWIWMLIDCLKSNLPPMEKLIWVLVIIFLNALGGLLYYFIARKKV